MPAMKFKIKSLFAGARRNSNSIRDGKVVVSDDPVRQIVQPGDARLISQLIAETHSMKTIGERMRHIAGRLLNRPYIYNPLVGSSTEPEVLVTRMDGFDCTTYLQTVLAISLSKTLDEFLNNLREIRYRDGKISYQTRLHYTVDWAAYQINRGLLTDLTLGEEVLTREKTLSFIKDLPPKTIVLRYYPKHAIDSVSRWLIDGDLIYFTSARRNLDVIHVGMIFRDSQHLFMRHAQAHRGRSIERDLNDFFRSSQFNGFIINRPKGT